jgi:hypothetical protein
VPLDQSFGVSISYLKDRFVFSVKMGVIMQDWMVAIIHQRPGELGRTVLGDIWRRW